MTNLNSVTYFFYPDNQKKLKLEQDSSQFKTCYRISRDFITFLLMGTFLLMFAPALVPLIKGRQSIQTVLMLIGVGIFYFVWFLGWSHVVRAILNRRKILQNGRPHKALIESVRVATGGEDDDEPQNLYIDFSVSIDGEEKNLKSVAHPYRDPLPLVGDKIYILYVDDQLHAIL